MEVTAYNSPCKSCEHVFITREGAQRHAIATGHTTFGTTWPSRHRTPEEIAAAIVRELEAEVDILVEVA